MKRIIYLLIGLCSVLGLQAQNFGSPAMRKLQLAEFAISNLYVEYTLSLHDALPIIGRASCRERV